MAVSKTLGFKNGDRLFFIDRMVHDVHACEVELSQHDLSTGEWMYKIHDLTGVGHCVVPANDLFVLEEDAKSALYEEDHRQLMQYKSEIVDAKSLVRFALNHVICGEDCDHIARLAFELRAEELSLFERTDRVCI